MDKEEVARWDEDIEKLICDYEEKTKEQKKNIDPVITWDQSERDSDGFKKYKQTRRKRLKYTEGPKEGTILLNKDSDDPDVEGLELQIQKHEEIINVDTEGEDQTEALPVDPELLTSHWLSRQANATEKWKESSPEIRKSLFSSECPVGHLCQHCNRNAVVRCRECLPKQFLCSDCDMAVHKHFVLHNRDSVVDRIFSPICPSVSFVETAAGHVAIKKQGCFLPLDLPQTICPCYDSNITMIPEKKVILINMKGCYKLYLPVLQCSTCKYRWKVGLPDVIRSGYWPATVSFSTVYSVDVLSNFQNIKVTAQLSRLAFLHLLDHQTLEFGRTGIINRTTFQRSFLEWVNVSDELNEMRREKASKRKQEEDKEQDKEQSHIKKAKKQKPTHSNKKESVVAKIKTKTGSKTQRDQEQVKQKQQKNKHRQKRVNKKQKARVKANATTESKCQQPKKKEGKKSNRQRSRDLKGPLGIKNMLV